MFPVSILEFLPGAHLHPSIFEYRSIAHKPTLAGRSRNQTSQEWHVASGKRKENRRAPRRSSGLAVRRPLRRKQLPRRAAWVYSVRTIVSACQRETRHERSHAPPSERENAAAIDRRYNMCCRSVLGPRGRSESSSGASSPDGEVKVPAAHLRHAARPGGNASLAARGSREGGMF